MQKLTKKKKERIKNNIRTILFFILLFSIIYSVIKIINAPSEVFASNLYTNTKSDYVLMLLQCLLGLSVMMLPSLIEQKKSIDIPDSIEIVYFVFLFLAIYLGEVRDFYYLIPYWDTILHAFSGCMLGALGFSLVGYLNNAEKLQFDLSPFFVALFAFCFALSAGTLWEIYEFLADGLLGLNMQKYILSSGVILSGHEALSDTMMDIMIDTLAALSYFCHWLYHVKKKKRRA